MAEGGIRTRPPAMYQVPESDSQPVVDPDILKTNRVLLVEELVELESVLAGLKPFLQCPELNVIHAEPNRGARIGKMIDYLQRRVVGKSYVAYNAFIKIVAGTQPDLFTTLVGRPPNRNESDFCIEDYVRATKEQIQASGHLTDSALDQKIDLDSEHVELAIVRDRSDSKVCEALPHQHRSHLSDIESKYDNIPVLQVLNREGRKKEKPKRVSLCGRAGTGKTTTMQWLARQWSLNKWATKFTMIFLIQLRMLSLSDFPMTAIELLTMYSIYRVTEEDLVTLGSSWIKTSAGKLLFFIDGLDEIGGLTSRLNNCPKIKDLNVKAHPIDICLNILRGDLLPRCTVVCASRPFTGLSAIQFDKRLEILGLTEARVDEYIKRKHPSKSSCIMSVIKESPLLMSVCSITFYCALISRLLADGVIFPNEDLRTYTRLIAFLMVQCVSRKLSEWPFIVEVHSYFPKLASLAYRGVIHNQMSGDISKLVFDEYDIVEAQLNPKELKSLHKFGVLQTKCVKNHLRPSVIAEFLHFSVQELLASAYLLSHYPKSDGIFIKLFSGGQFNMALLYMFGLQYDTGSSWVKDIRFAVDPSRQGFSQIADTEISDFLEYLCQKCVKEKNNYTTKLQICQLLHESQMEDKAKSVARYIVPDGVLAIEHTPMAMIDLMAVRFVCKYVDSISRIYIVKCSLAVPLPRFLASTVLKDHDKTLHTLQLQRNMMGADGAQAIGEWLKQNHTLLTLDVGANNIGENGAKAFAEALHHNSTLQTLDVCGNNIGENGANTLAEALHHNNTLQTLIVWGSNIGENGAKALAKALHHNKTLQVLNVGGNNIGENGSKAFAEALCHKNTLESLNVGANNIGDNGAKALAEALQRNLTLQILDVSGNQIDENGAKAFAETLCHNNILKTLNVWGNSIGENGAKALAEALHQNNTLQMLHLSNSNIGENGAKALAEALQQNNTLQVIDVSFNNIGENGVKALAEIKKQNKKISIKM